MTWNNFIQGAIYLAVLLSMVKPLGIYMARVYTGKGTGPNAWLAPVEGLIYRLSGDTNALHVDPEFAKAAGFPRPVLHPIFELDIPEFEFFAHFPDLSVKFVDILNPHGL